MGEPLGSSGRGRGGATDFDGLADQAPARLEGAGQPAVGPEGGGGDTPQHASRSTIRFGVVAGRGSGQAGSGVVAPAPRPTTKTTEQRLLTALCPLPPLCAHSREGSQKAQPSQTAQRTVTHNVDKIVDISANSKH